MKLQGQGHSVKNVDTHSKVLSEDPNETFFWLKSSDLGLEITHHLPRYWKGSLGDNTSFTYVLEGEPDPIREY